MYLGIILHLGSRLKSCTCYISRDAISNLPLCYSGVPIFCSNLVKIMQWVTESNPTERQVRSIAKSMFRKMAGDGKVIPKSEIDERAKTLLSSQSAPSAGTSTSLNELKSSVKHLLHSALLLSGTDEVG